MEGIKSMGLYGIGRGNEDLKNTRATEGLLEVESSESVTSSTEIFWVPVHNDATSKPLNWPFRDSDCMYYMYRLGWTRFAEGCSSTWSAPICEYHIRTAMGAEGFTRIALLPETCENCVRTNG